MGGWETAVSGWETETETAVGGWETETAVGGWETETAVGGWETAVGGWETERESEGAPIGGDAIGSKSVLLASGGKVKSTGSVDGTGGESVEKTSCADECIDSVGSGSI